VFSRLNHLLAEHGDELILCLVAMDWQDPRKSLYQLARLVQSEGPRAPQGHRGEFA
jgi:hypothetical protein